MDKELHEYNLAINESLEAIQDEFNAKDRRRKAHYRLINAREAVRNAEQDILEQGERSLNN